MSRSTTNKSQGDANEASIGDLETVVSANTAKHLVADSRTSIVAHVAVETADASADGVVDASKARGTGFVELAGAGDQQNYPSVSVDLSAGDELEISGHLAVDLVNYNDGPDTARVSLWRGAVGSGTLLNPLDVVLGGSGDNIFEVVALHYPAKRFAITVAGPHTVCWALRFNNTNARGIGILGVRSYVQAVRHKSVVLPIF